MRRQRVPGLPGWENEFGIQPIVELDDESQCGADRLPVRIGVAVEAKINRHAVAGRGKRSDAEQWLQPFAAAERVVQLESVNLTPTPIFHIWPQASRDLRAGFTQ